MAQDRRPPWFAWVGLLIIYLVWGSTYLAIRIVVRSMPPFATAGLRFFAAGSVMALAAAITDRVHGFPSRHQLAEQALVGFLLLALGNAGVMWAEQRIPSGIAALIVATVPLWTALLNGLRAEGRPFTVRIWLGVLIGLAGVGLVVRPGAEAAHLQWAGIAAIQLSTLAWTVGSLYTQSTSRRLPLASASAVQMLAGSIALLIESRLAGEDLGRWHTAPLEAWLALLYLAVFGSLLGFTAFAYCLRVLPASTVATYAYVNPVVAVVLGTVFLDERLSAGLAGGGLLIVVAVILTTLPKSWRWRAGRPGALSVRR